MKHILINEIFLSIQGESINTNDSSLPSIGVGVPTIFVRTFGCPVHCVYCDSKYAWQGSESKSMTVEEIVDKVEELGKGCHKVVCITGGEPGIHKYIGILIEKLREKGYVVSVETSGSVDIEKFEAANSIVMDYKGPSAGDRAMNKMLPSNLQKLCAYDQLKFLVKDRTDFQYMLNVIEESQILKYDNRPVILVSPVFDDEGNSNAAQVVEWMLETNLPLVLNFQIHKIIWNVNKRGV